MGSRREVCRFRRCVYLAVVLFTCGLLLSPAFGASVDTTRVRRMVKGWLKSNPQAFSFSVGRSISNIEVCGERDSVYYAVDLKGGGFVIAPVDDRIEPVIAFSGDSGPYSETHERFREIMEADIRARFRTIGEAERDDSVQPLQIVPLSSETQKRWALLEAYGARAGTLALPPLSSLSDVRVDPLIETHWDQTTCCTDPNLACYNYFTPPADPNLGDLHGDPDNYPSGCSATAMAQILKYHRMPSAAIGIESMPVQIDAQHLFRRTLGGDGNGGPYRWDLMVNRPDCNTSDQQRRAIGALCHDAGVLSRTVYSKVISWANSKFICDGFLRCGFKKVLLARNDLKPLGDSVIPMINPNLDAHLPVILGMYIADSNSGHALIVDGYGYHGEAMYHHVNMGFSGALDMWWNLPNVGNLSLITDCVCNIFSKTADINAESDELLSGRVLDPNGDPLEGAEIEALGPDGLYETDRSDAKGIYALWPLRSATEYVIRVQRHGYVFASRRIMVGTSVDNTKKTGNRWGVDFHGVPAQGGLKVWKGVYGIPVPQGGDFVKAAPGTNFGLALRADGSVAYWGIDSPLLNSLPSPNTGFVDVACGSLHCVALKDDGTIAAWGTNLSGQLNAPSHRFKAIDAMGNVTAGITDSGQIVIWGQTQNWDQPPVGSFKAMSLGGGFVLGLREDGSLAATGDNREGQCEVPDGNDFVAIAATDTHSVALRRDGSIEAWGQDLYYNWIERCKPKGKGYIGISASRSGNCALRDDGSLVVWTSGGLHESGGRWFTVATSRYGDLTTIAAPIPGDIVPNARVDCMDLAALRADWGKNYDKRNGVWATDLNADGSVDTEDLSEFSHFWLTDNGP